MSSFVGQEPAALISHSPSPDVGLGAGAVGITFGPFCVKGFLNGRIRGNAHQDVAGDLLVTFGNSPASMDLEWLVPQDAGQPGFQYPFDIIVLQPYVSFSFTNGLAASAFFRANLQALPI